MEITLVRHGQSEHNAGLTEFLDSPLTPIGQLQAERTGEKLKDSGITKGFASPLLRTLQTMAAIARYGNFPVNIEPQLHEYFSTELYRHFPGMTLAKITSEFSFCSLPKTRKLSDPWWATDIEDTLAIYQRCAAFRDYLAANYADEAHVLIVSHAETVGRLIEALQFVPPNLEGPPWSQNCGISRLSWDLTERPAEVKYINDMSHLP
jgi:broad specificity phosphatase PhoE